jgi:5-methyltetrahydrofolate--homocysteine methyltransferase
MYDETLVGNAPRVLELTNEALGMDMEPQSLLFDSLIPALEEVGARFERGDFFVPEMLIAGRAMAGAMEVLRPLLADTGVETIGKFLMGTVKGDVHDIGKNLVNIMLEGAGFEVIDLGVQVPPEKFVEAIETHQPDVVGFSAFLTTTMPMFKANMNALEKAGIRDTVIVMVGGAPVTQEYADAVGADGYAADASPRSSAPRPCSTRSAARYPHERAAARDRPALGHQGGRDRPRPALLPDRRADQPDRPSDLPGAAPGPATCRRSSATSRPRSRGGADVLDINMGVPLTDEAELLAKAITMVQELTDLPICIDSSVVEALEAGLSVYQGRALVNSITAEDDRMASILPLVKKYDAGDHRASQRPRRDPDGGGEADPAHPEDHRRRHHRVRHRPGRHRDRPARDADRRGHHHLAGHPRHDAADQGALRRQHDLRRVQRLVRHARPAHARGGVPPDGDDRRPDQRDHGHPHPADRRRGQGGRPGARPRRVGHGMDRGAPRPDRGSRRGVSDIEPVPDEGPADFSPRRTAGKA